MFAISLRILFSMIGAAFFLTSVDSLIQIYRFPVAKNELSVVSGTLSAASYCPSGRFGRTFKVTLIRDYLPLRFSLGCPSSTYTKLRKSIGKKVQMSYNKKRGPFFMPIIDVYELDVDEYPFIKYEDRVAYNNKVKPLTTSLSIFTGLLGLIIIGACSRLKILKRIWL